MSTGTSTHAILNAGSVVVSFLATMVAFWSFGHSRLGWGAYNMVIATVGLLTFVAVRARADKA